MNNKKRRFPLWLPCLILFFLLVAGTVHFIRAGVASIPADTPDFPPSASPEMVLPEAADVPLEETYSEAALPNESSVEAEIIPVDSGNTSSSENMLPNESDTFPSEVLPLQDEEHVHHYVNGVCDVCGSKPVFYTSEIPDELLAPAQHRGDVSLHEYKVTNYGNHGFGEIDKCFRVYLPYGYDESQKYPVLILMHGANDDQDSWLLEEHEYKDGRLSGSALLDRMIELGYCKPCIVVSPAFETKVIQGITAAVYQMRDELRSYILPYLVEHYSTYAENSSLESISAARDYFALGGLSDGALFVYEGGMRYNFDLFGNYVAFSGNGEPWKTVSAIQNGDWTALPVQCLFTGAGGDTDIQQHYTEIGYDYFIENDSRFRAEENAWHVDVNGGHTWKTWLTELCNALPLLFP